MSTDSINRNDLKQQIIDLGPWHLDVDIADGLGTSVSKGIDYRRTRKFGFNVSFLNPKQGFQQTLKAIFPDGLENRSVLDSACNCGAYSFWCKEMGAGRTFGFDAREHWIKQAKFINQHRKYPYMDFQVCEIDDLPKLALPRFDVTLFKGILYHLPDPIHSLKLVADLTREVMILNSAVASVVDPEPQDGCMFLSLETNTSYMSGINRLNWYPSGPNVLIKILEWCGFEEIKVHFYIKSLPVDCDTSSLSESKGRVEIIAARKPGMLDRIVPTIHETGK